MTRAAVLSLVLGSLVLLSAMPADAAIPAFNATCPGGRSVHADEGGPVFVDGRAMQLKRFNDDYYEARDGQSGATVSISRSPDGGVQLSWTGKGGANGVCTLGDAAVAAPAQAAPRELPREVTCESRDHRQTECDMDTRGDVRMVRQLSDTRCEQGRNWGLNRHSIWVSDGCRAVFRNVGNAKAPAAPAGDTLLGACNARAGKQGALVTLVPVNDEVTELIVDYDDGRYLCMVRNDGRVESLGPIRKR
ncbi:DUF3011 domain-containing protein [Lysobacter auxotrophicus]|uniref:DUF3011 domain-containing protein n=1 Tax=Lysobacter auxotrophicus TaxID=2992573 RepID=A0ABM8DDS3_9GAMM|nr:DUF3011 domain-containing protein [Lysobacter auxotrophicus]BDU16750.1 DUF3011 domain-containing protein [Lysobacter auxotrophicus]